jgi:predicted ArsR family transcriptional regulator
MADRTVKVKLITHLMECRHSRDEHVFPVTMTQAGMAGALGIGRTHAGNELRKLEEEGCVEAKTAYIETGTRRMIVYTLTPVGRSLGRRFAVNPG